MAETVLFFSGSALSFAVALAYCWMAWLGRRDKSLYWYGECATAIAGFALTVIFFASGIFADRHITRLEAQLEAASKEATDANKAVAARKLSLEQMRVLQDRLEAAEKVPLQIATYKFDDEAVNLFAQIAMTLIRAKWKCEYVEEWKGGSVNGVVVFTPIINTSDEKELGKQLIPAALLCDALEKSGVDGIHLNHSELVPNGTLFLVVGHKEIAKPNDLLLLPK
ncbi:MAG TPA: hypothetical protein VFE46_14665 [Pirellulales bacterium]|jgi:hypothetical protein|nr:hypothetical protein [Pirellulales bacterium]